MINPENPSRQEIEAKVTALLLGELPEDEARVLRFAITQDAGLQKLHDRLQVTIGLVREVEAKPTGTAPLKLSEDRRQQLMAHFKTPRPRESFLVKPMKLTPARLGVVLAAVAIIGVAVAVIFPAVKPLSKNYLALTSHLQGSPDEAESSDDLKPTAESPQGGAKYPLLVSTNYITPQLLSTGGVYSQDVVGYVNVPTGGSNVVTEAFTKVEVPPAATIVLPPAGLPEENPDLATMDRAKEVVADKTDANALAQHTVDTQARMPQVEKQWVLPGTSSAAALPAPASQPALPTMADNSAPEVPPAATITLGPATVQADSENRQRADISDKQMHGQIQSFKSTFAISDTQALAPMAGIDRTRRMLKQANVDQAQPVAETAPAASLPETTPPSSWATSDFHQKNVNSDVTLEGRQQALHDQGSTQALAYNFPSTDESGGNANVGTSRQPVSGFGGFGGTGGIAGGGGFAGGGGGGGGAGRPVDVLSTRIQQNVQSSSSSGYDTTINPTTGLPVPESSQPAAANPMGAFPGSTATLALDSTKESEGQASAGRPTDGFYRNDASLTNGVVALGDIPVTGHLFTQNGTTFAQRLINVQPGSAGTSAVTSGAMPAHVPDNEREIFDDVTPTPTLDKDELDKLHYQLIEGQRIYSEQETQLQALKDIAATNREKLQEVVPTMFPDTALSDLEGQLRDTRQKYNAALQDYSVTNIVVTRLGSLQNTLQQEIDGRVDGVMAGLESQTRAKKATLDELQGQLDSAKQADLDNATKYQPYYEAKTKLAQLEDTHKLLYSKIKAESIDAAIPKTTMVQVTDAAQPQTNQSLWQKFTGQYASTARIQVQNDGGIIQGMATPAASGFVYDPYFIQNTFEVLQSQVVLSNTITRLDLNDTWGKKFNNGQPLTTDETMRMLKGHLSLTPVKNTKLINITITESDPQEAAAIANAVAQSYSDYRAQQTKQIATAGLAALNESYLDISNRIQEQQAEVDRLRPNKALESQKPDAPLPKAAPNAPVPQPEIQVKDNAFSTFSMNVSDVSFQLAAASLEKGRLPEAASIRSEEFINAFDYRDPEPSGGERIAFNWERSQDPFAHNRDFLRFSLKTAATGREPGRPLNLVLLLDDSGSMERADRVAIIQEALRILATQLQPQDTLSIVTFARTAHLWADGISGDKAGAVLDQVGGLTPEGGTNLEEAMRLAYETARRHYLANGLNRVVLITDGAANLGDVDTKDLKAKVDANRKQGIALDCFGIGWEDYNDDLLEQLSSQGDGRYAFLNTPADAHNDFATKLAGALQIAASGVKVQVEFNPRRTVSYRQIGYATHQLTKQQFHDNTVAAGELAAAESGNGLYTVEVNPEGDGPIATVHVRYQIPGTTDYREQSWDVPYNGRSAALDKSSPAMRLAVSAAAFSEWLTASPYAAEVNPDELLNYLNGVPEVYSPDPRPKKLEWMIRQAKSATGPGSQY